MGDSTTNDLLATFTMARDNNSWYCCDDDSPIVVGTIRNKISCTILVFSRYYGVGFHRTLFKNLLYIIICDVFAAGIDQCPCI